MQPNPITVLLAKLYDALKARNATIALVIAVLLGFAYKYFENNDVPLLGEELESIIQYIIFVLLGITGARTTTTLAQASKQEEIS